MTETELEAIRTSGAGYSSRLRLDLEVDGRLVPLAQLGHDRVILASPIPLRPGPAQTVLCVDGVEQRSAVHILPHPPGSLRIPIAR
jgi:hypothetical protein